MEFITKNFLSALFLLTITITASCSSVLGQVAGGTPTHCSFAGLYNFGDANSDTGAISAAFLRIGPPNGVSFFNKPAGRVSDGRLLIDFIAEHIGLPYLGAYLDTINTDYRHGANFATGGSTIRRVNETIFQTGVSPFSLDIQTIQFTQFKARTIELYQQGAQITADRSELLAPQYFSSALYTIDIGQNDLSVGFRTLTDQQLRAELPNIINEFAASVRRLYQVGARSFWIHNVGPIGCFPLHSLYIPNPKPGSFDQYGCIKSQNDVVMEFNRQLKDRIIKLRSELSHAAITYVDVYTAKYRLISTANSQGFNDPMKICCGRHGKDVHVWCGHRANVGGTEVFGDACPNPSTHISWDGLHYTQAANHWVANLILNGSLSDPPISVREACIKPK